MSHEPERRRSRFPGRATSYLPTPSRISPDYLSWRAAPRQGGLLEIRRGPGVGEQISLPGDRVATIGRDRRAGLRLNHRSVSRKHAEIHPQDGGFVLADTGSSNGTYLQHGTQQTRVTHARLADGDSIIVGVFALLYHGPS
jgi:pSer/pThr/pTyr-binding forkhead associated (FHA) protein